MSDHSWGPQFDPHDLELVRDGDNGEALDRLTDALPWRPHDGPHGPVSQAVDELGPAAVRDAKRASIVVAVREAGTLADPDAIARKAKRRTARHLTNTATTGHGDPLRHGVMKTAPVELVEATGEHVHLVDRPTALERLTTSQADLDSDLVGQCFSVVKHGSVGERILRAVLTTDGEVNRSQLARELDIHRSTLNTHLERIAKRVSSIRRSK